MVGFSQFHQMSIQSFKGSGHSGAIQSYGSTPFASIKAITRKRVSKSLWWNGFSKKRLQLLLGSERVPGLNMPSRPSRRLHMAWRPSQIQSGCHYRAFCQILGMNEPGSSRKSHLPPIQFYRYVRYSETYFVSRFALFSLYSLSSNDVWWQNQRKKRTTNYSSSTVLKKCHGKNSLGPSHI